MLIVSLGGVIDNSDHVVEFWLSTPAFVRLNGFVSCTKCLFGTHSPPHNFKL